MALTEVDITHLGKLARLDLAPDVRQKFAEQISRILEYVDTLATVETKTDGKDTPSLRVAPTHLAPDRIASVDADPLLALARKREGRSIVSPPLNG